jgi:DNA-binding LytR/AlgR family response regulator
MKSLFRSHERAATAMIVEDEPPLRDELAEVLRALWPELEIIGSAGDGAQALALFEREQPDVVFLDIQIPGPSGLDVASLLAGRCHVVFVTAYDMHAIEAFEKGALDYVLKPIALDRFAVTVRRLKERLRGRREHLPVSEGFAAKYRQM